MYVLNSLIKTRFSEQKKPFKTIPAVHAIKTQKW